MGWGYGQNTAGREVGYMVAAECDKAGCITRIDRGLSFVCGGMHDGGEHGCGKYFCGSHLVMSAAPDQLCEACADEYEVAHPEDDEEDDET